MFIILSKIITKLFSQLINYILNNMVDNFKQSILLPAIAQYNRWLKDPYLTQNIRFKGGSSVGNDFVSRHFQTYVHYARQKFVGLNRRYESVQLSDLLQDNWVRLIALNGIERLITLRQAFPGLKTRFLRPDSISYHLTQITQGGFFNGWLRGVTFSVLQFAGVLFPALYLANQQKHKFRSFLTYYTIFDVLLYPLDRLKTLAYADTSNTFKNWADYKNLKTQWIGLSPKLLFNIPLLWTYYNTMNDSSLTTKAISWGLLALFYPLSTLKVRMQISNTGLSFNDINDYKILFRGGYRGLLTFLLFNGLANMTIYNFYSSNQMQQASKEFQREGLRFKRN